jgi:hypothetical protein
VTGILKQCLQSLGEAERSLTKQGYMVIHCGMTSAVLPIGQRACLHPSGPRTAVPCGTVRSIIRSFYQLCRSRVAKPVY